MIVKLYKTEPSVKELSREYVVSQVTIYKWIRKISPITSMDDLEEIRHITFGYRSVYHLKSHIIMIQKSN